nr:putative fatty acyl-CoA reductase CG5065 [Megalopta genalis]XP_033325149.1 putative fatty acyl-CoA reductase CG5065 [Megalopta genalis]
MSSNAVQMNKQHRNDDKCIHGGSIEAFYSDTVVLVTGATGFIGKALVEKLLRSCSRLLAIFILIRPKKGNTVDQRLKQLLESSVFDKLRKENPSAFDKIHAIKSDLTMPDLGLSPEDKEMLIQRVNIVFHGAATIRFDEPLKVAVALNMQGTDRIIDLCCNMKNLISFAFVSTAYSNTNQKEVKEAVYASRLKPSMVMDICDSLDDKTINMLEKNLLGKHPNTYTFTKNLAEQLILTKAAHLPVAIIRPSIVGAARKEPYPGWVDNAVGLTGCMLNIIKGTLKVAVAFHEKYLDLVPVDYVIDTLICAAWYTTMQPRNCVKVYNCTAKYPLNWGQFFSLTVKHAIQNPTKRVVRYPSINYLRSIIPFYVFMYFFEYLPAIVADAFLSIKGKTPKMLKAVKRLSRVIHYGSYFSCRDWEFQQKNMEELTDKVKALKDSDNFDTNMSHHNWDTFVRDFVLGIRKYLLNDDPEIDNKLQSRLSILYFLHRFTQVSSIIVLLIMILRFSH